VSIRFDALFTNEGSNHGTLRFEIRDEEDNHVGYYSLDVAPSGLGTTDGMLAQGHRRMAEIVRGWEGRLLGMAAHFEER
jgi:hypothetical protein